MAVSQVFTTTGSQTWNWPSGVTSVDAEALGGGGGSGTASGNPATGGGGMGGSYAKATITKGAETLLTIVVGTGGAVAGAGAASTVDQAATIRVRAAGGAGGATQAASSANGAGGTTQNGTPVGTTLFSGGAGGTGNFTSGTQGSGAGGGAAGPTSAGGAASVNTAGIVGTGAWLNGNTYQVAGRAGVGNSTPGIAGINYGGAASGGKASSGADQNGAVGAQGIVVLTWIPPDQAVTGVTLASTAVLFAASSGDVTNAGPLSGSNFINTTAVTIGGQTFSGHAGVLTAISLWVGQAGASADVSVLQLELWLGSWLGTFLTNGAQLTVTALPTTAGWVTFTLNTPQTLVAGSTYAIKLIRATGGSISRTVTIYRTQGNQYAGGDVLTNVGNIDTVYDCRFILQGIPAQGLTVSLPPVQTVATVVRASTAVLNPPANVDDGIRRITTAFLASTIVLNKPAVDGGAVVVPPTVTAWQQGFNFRATAGFVTDKADQTYVLPSTTYPTTRNGVTFGWTYGPYDARDRVTDAGHSPELSGTNFNAVDVLAPVTFRVDLPAPGDYIIRLALGDQAFPKADAGCLILDDTTTVLTIPKQAIATDTWVDASNIARSASVWKTNNGAVIRTFASTKLILSLTNPSTGTSDISHLSIKSVQTVTDTFDRADAATLGPDWTATASNMQIVSNTARGLTDSVQAYVYRSKERFDPIEHASEATFVQNGTFGDDTICMLTVRHQENGDNYAVWFHSVPGDRRMSFVKRVGGVETTLGNFSGSVVADGHRYRLEAYNSAIRLLDNDVPVATFIDTDLVGGKPGHGIFMHGVAWNDWKGYGVLDRTPLNLNGLIGWWDMDEFSGNLKERHSKLDMVETGGTIARVAMGTRFGKQFVYNSPFKHFEYPDTRVLSFGTGESLSVTVRFAFTGGPGFDQFAMLGKQVYGNREWIIIYRSNDTGGGPAGEDFWGLKFVIQNVGSVAIPDAAWSPFGSIHTLVCWFDQPNGVMGMRLDDSIEYIKTGLTGSVGDGTNPFKIGYGEDTNAEAWSGPLGSVTLWRRLFTPEEKTLIHNKGTGVAHDDVWVGNVLDSFDRANSGTLGSNWTNTQNGMQIASNKAIPTVNFADNSAVFVGQALQSDHFVEGVFASTDTSASRASLHVCANAANTDRYHLDIYITGGNAVLYKLVSGGYTSLLTLTGVTPASGDKWRLQRMFPFLLVYRNDVLIGTVSDSALTGALTGIGAVYTSDSWNDFASGPLAIPPSGPTTPTISGATIASTVTLFLPVVTGGSSSGPQAVTGVRIASSLALSAPTVARAGDLTASMIGHWPFNELSASADVADVHGTNPLTRHGTNTVAQNPIDGTPARDMELDTATYFEHANNADLNVAGNQPWTLVMRCKFESVTDVAIGLADKLASGATLSGNWGIYWDSGEGFSGWGTGSTQLAFANTNPAHLTLTPGATYVVAGGYDPALQKVWVRVNNDARVYADLAETTGDASDTFAVGMFFGPSPTWFLDGGAGPLTFWKRVLTDAELDHWISVKGDYASIGGTVSGQSVTGATIASTATLSLPAVFPAQDLTAGLVGQWPMNETGATSNALDVHGTSPLAFIDNGGGNIGQDPIDHTPARDVKSTSHQFFRGTDASLVFSSNQAFTILMRLKFDSFGGYSEFLSITSPWTIYVYLDGVHLNFELYNATSTAKAAVDVVPVVLGASYVFVFGYDPATSRVWVRVNGGARAESPSPLTGGTASGTSFNFGSGDQTWTTDALNGAIGPVSYFKRSLSDAEIDYWIGVKGDYSKIGGSAPPQNVAGATIASAVALSPPTIVPLSGNDFNVGGNQPWTVIARLKFESIPSPMGIGMKVQSGASGVVGWGVYWGPTGGFVGVVTGAGGGELVRAQTAPAHTAPTAGATYIVAAGYDPSTQKVWVRVNTDARISVAVPFVTADLADLWLIGAIWNTTTATWNFDGGVGPVTFLKRVVNDVELDYWISVKGDYASITGSALTLLM